MTGNDDGRKLRTQKVCGTERMFRDREITAEHCERVRARVGSLQPIKAAGQP
jgi:hypothetical protein